MQSDTEFNTLWTLEKVFYSVSVLQYMYNSKILVSYNE
jgi:hypothetical protein